MGLNSNEFRPLPDQEPNGIKSIARVAAVVKSHNIFIALEKI